MIARGVCDPDDGSSYGSFRCDNWHPNECYSQGFLQHGSLIGDKGYLERSRFSLPGRPPALPDFPRPRSSIPASTDISSRTHDACKCHHQDYGALISDDQIATSPHFNQHKMLSQSPQDPVHYQQPPNSRYNSFRILPLGAGLTTTANSDTKGQYEVRPVAQSPLTYRAPIPSTTQSNGYLRLIRR